MASEHLDHYRSILEPRLDEPLVALQVFSPADRWRSGTFGLGRIARLARSGGSDLEARLPARCLLALTPAHVLALPVSYARGQGAVIGDAACIWARDGLAATVQETAMLRWGNTMVRPNMLGDEGVFERLALSGAEGTLRADLVPGEPATAAVLDALQPERRSPRRARWWE